MAASTSLAVYISGPMTGYQDHNFPAFMAAEQRLADLGHTPLNPARNGSDPAKTWADYLRADLIDVVNADAVCLLPGWEGSRGARLEVHVAQALGMSTVPLEQWTEVCR